MRLACLEMPPPLDDTYSRCDEGERQKNKEKDREQRKRRRPWKFYVAQRARLLNTQTVHHVSIQIDPSVDRGLIHKLKRVTKLSQD